MVKVGDFVEVTDIDLMDEGYIEIGKTYEVIEVDEDGDIYVRNSFGDSSFVCEGDFKCL